MTIRLLKQFVFSPWRWDQFQQTNMYQIVDELERCHFLLESIGDKRLAEIECLIKYNPY